MVTWGSNKVLAQGRRIALTQGSIRVVARGSVMAQWNHKAVALESKKVRGPQKNVTWGKEKLNFSLQPSICFFSVLSKLVGY